MNADERAQIAQHFSVAPEQVERDHLISHLLAYLSKNFSDRIQFIGGTALARTHLPALNFGTLEAVPVMVPPSSIQWSQVQILSARPRKCCLSWVNVGCGDRTPVRPDRILSPIDPCGVAMVASRREDDEVAARVELFEAIRTDRRREQLSVRALAERHQAHRRS
jgi:hypothetical protein